jgi:NADPH:quinone reductase-like Zn-dependent oxidoreductase
MKAVVYTEYGSPEVLQLKQVEKPIPGDDEVLIKVHAASVNSWDWDLLRGVPFVNRIMAGLLKPTKIQILGCDVAGRIEAVGKYVKLLRSGDEVFGDLSGCGWGGFAEYVCARDNAVTLKPASMTFEQAAAIPQAGLLALQGLRDKGQVQAGQKVLINGAGGGVGTFALQMAKSFGAEVTCVDSTDKLDMLRSIGADDVIDYRNEDFTRKGQQYDLILDVMGYHSIFDYKRALSPRGKYVMVGGCTALVNQVLLLGPWISLSGSKQMGLLLHKPNKGLDFMKELFETGKVVPVIDRRYPLSEVADALRYLGEGHVKGKVVISVVHTNKT